MGEHMEHHPEVPEVPEVFSKGAKDATVERLRRALHDLELVRTDALKTLMLMTGFTEEELFEMARLIWPGRQL
jgi:hypothetical protein